MRSLLRLRGGTLCLFDAACRYASALPRINMEHQILRGKYDTRYNGRIKKRQWEDTPIAPPGVDSENVQDEAKKARTEPFIRIKRKKVAMLLGYSGVDYFGMQRNPSVASIEEDLFKALLATDHISKEAFELPQMIQFQRAARTDKGVSAIRQIVSIKLPEEIKISEINQHLPPVIKVFAYKRVTKGFNAKSNCHARTYMYVLPTYSFENYQVNVQDHKSYRVKPEVLEEVNRLLKKYEGSRNFHNFTSKRCFIDPASKRYIMSFQCEEPFIVDGMEFTTMKVKGQSFMMHQIRKMVGLILAVIKGVTTDDIIEKAQENAKYDLPMAPGLGLMLNQVHYDRYDSRYGQDGFHEPLIWDTYEPEIEEFKNKYIYPNIINTEINEMPMASWLETLPLHSYDVRTDDKVAYVEGAEEDSDNEVESFEDETKLKGGESEIKPSEELKTMSIDAKSESQSIEAEEKSIQ